jgi:tetratricopeptide (TPR) repeat protein
MMIKGSHLAVAGTALLLLTACSNEGGLSIRPVATGFAAGSQSADFRVNEARAHFALGNIALAAEGFRRALRENPDSVDALNGLAACYDRMGRFDLSRSFYEKALALAPGDARLYANLALSLDLQGERQEAAQLRDEARTRFAAIEAIPLGEPVSVAADLNAAPAVSLGGSVEPSSTVLAEAPPAPPSAALTVPLAEVRQAPPSTSPAQPRLERLALGEVALRTGAGPSWRPLREASPLRTAVRRLTPSRDRPVIVVLNGTERGGLAAQARLRLRAQGWQRIAIGNAAQPLRSSQILYAPARAAEARRLARSLGLPARQRAFVGDRLVVQLGRDRLALRKRA